MAGYDRLGCCYRLGVSNWLGLDDRFRLDDRLGLDSRLRFDNRLSCHNGLRYGYRPGLDNWLGLDHWFGFDHWLGSGLNGGRWLGLGRGLDGWFWLGLGFGSGFRRLFGGRFRRWWCLQLDPGSGNHKIGIGELVERYQPIHRGVVAIGDVGQTLPRLHHVLAGFTRACCAA